MEEEIKWNNYFIEGTNVLKNKLNINNQELLTKKETEITLKKLVELYLNPIKGNFDSKHLKNIHKHLFNDIYEFAGEFRNVNLVKTSASPFTNYKLIEVELEEILNNVEKNILSKSINDFFYAEQLANLYHRLIKIHPFREGNGRTIREFMREFVEHCNYYFEDYEYELDFNRKEVDKEKLFEGTIAYQNQIGDLVLQFYNALKKTKKEKGINNLR